METSAVPLLAEKQHSTINVQKETCSSMGTGKPLA